MARLPPSTTYMPMVAVLLVLGGCAVGGDPEFASIPSLGGGVGSGDDIGSTSGEDPSGDLPGSDDESDGSTGEPDPPDPEIGMPLSQVGCADGEREGFVDPVTHPGIAACAGGWTVPGIVPAPPPSCELQGGDDTINPGGAGCSATDLCATGWHVCNAAVEVAAWTGSGCADLGAPGFFMMAQSGPGWRQCGEGDNGLFGCGTMGERIDSPSCVPLHLFSGRGCEDLPLTWNCGVPDLGEARQVAKPSPEDGGVLCCLDT